MKYVYNNKLELLNSFFDEITEADIFKEFGYDVYITNDKINYPIVRNGKLEEMTEEEIQQHKYTEYIEKKYTLKENEVISDNKIIAYTPKEFEYVENGEIKYRKDDKVKDLFSKIKREKEDILNYGFIYKDNLRQPCREQDKTSITSILLMMSTMGLNDTDWKFFDKDDADNFIFKKISKQELMILGQKLTAVIYATMQSEAILRNKIKEMDIDTLKKLDIKTEYKGEYIKCLKVMAH